MGPPPWSGPVKPAKDDGLQFMLAVIGGSGLTKLSSLEVARREVLRTPYGEPSSALVFGQLAGRDAVFLARHGHGHTIPPHRVNYRANLWALKESGATQVIAVASVGGIRGHKPGTLALPVQLLDYTSGRANTYFDGDDHKVVHADFTHPYTSTLRAHCLAAAARAGVPIFDGGVYAAVNGPRLETAAEIDRLERDGATMVGMTGMPEAVLARELDLAYTALAVIVNHAAGRGDSQTRISLDDLYWTLEAGMTGARALLEKVAPMVEGALP
jgi:5'-methylthioadenosine phosphorylase